jgi:hypothetical protein
MKRLFTACILVLLVCAVAGAVQIETGTYGQKVSDVNPLATKIIDMPPVTATVSISTITAELATGTNTIGGVNVITAPAIAAGNAMIGYIRTYDFGLGAAPIVNVTVGSTSASLTAVASRSYVVIQNQDDATSLWVYNGATATISSGLEVLPGSSIERPWGSAVSVAYISSEAVVISVEQGVLP